MSTEEMSVLRRLGRAFLEGCGGFILGGGATFVANFVLLAVLARFVFPGADGAGLTMTAGVGVILLPLAAGVLFFIVRFYRTWTQPQATQPSNAPEP